MNITNTIGYKLSKLVLSKKEPFSLEDIHTEMNNKGVPVSSPSVKYGLRVLRDNGVIVQHGRTFSVN